MLEHLNFEEIHMSFTRMKTEHHCCSYHLTDRIVVDNHPTFLPPSPLVYCEADNYNLQDFIAAVVCTSCSLTRNIVVRHYSIQPLEAV